VSLLQITTLPTELQLIIFENLRSDFSACLGLTCKKFYAMHRAFHGSIPFNTVYPCDCLGDCKERLPEFRQFGHRSQLPILLYLWMHHAGYELANSNHIFQRSQQIPVLNGPWQIGKDSIAKFEWALRFGEFGQGMRKVPQKAKAPFKKAKQKLAGKANSKTQDTSSREETVLVRSPYERLDSGEFTLERVHLCKLWSPEVLRRVVR